MPKKSKKRVAFEAMLDEISTIPNEELFSRFQYLSMGDDYENCFTPDGGEEFNVLANELSKRLMDYGFLKQSIREICGHLPIK